MRATSKYYCLFSLATSTVLNVVGEFQTWECCSFYTAESYLTEDSRRFFYKRDRQRKYKVTLRRVRVIICLSAKTINLTYSECVFLELIIQHGKRVPRIILLSLPCPVLQLFSSPLTHKRYNYRRRAYCKLKSELDFSKRMSAAFNIIRSIKGNMIININRSSYKVTNNGYILHNTNLLYEM